MVRWLCLFAMGCGGAAAEAQPEPAGTATTASLEVLQVVRPDGEIEQVYAHVEVPEGEGPFPVVVYAHGQSLDSAFRCQEGPPSDAVSEHAALVAQGLAARGWLTVAPLYRNRGPDAPLVGELWPRDHRLLDASAVLAAAHLGASHPQGDARVGLLGLSMGSFPVLWAASEEPALAPLQEGLDLRIAISGGMLGDHLGNIGRTVHALDAEEDLARAEAITFAVVGALQFLSFERGHDPIVDSSFVADLLTGRGQSLVQEGLLVAASCEGVVGPPICAIDCFTDTFYEVLGDAPLQAESFLAPEAVDAWRFWETSEAADPGAAHPNPLLAALRAASPAYGLPGARVPRLVAITSVGDHVVQQQLAYGSEPLDRFLAALAATGAEAEHIAIDAEGCGHEDYLLPHRPECGFDALTAALAASLESP